MRPHSLTNAHITPRLLLISMRSNRGTEQKYDKCFVLALGYFPSEVKYLLCGKEFVNTPTTLSATCIIGYLRLGHGIVVVTVRWSVHIISMGVDYLDGGSTARPRGWRMRWPHRESGPWDGRTRGRGTPAEPHPQVKLLRECINVQ